MPLTKVQSRGTENVGAGSSNLIINGAMNVAQRATSVASVSDGSNEGYQSLDRFSFNYSNSAGGVATISQDNTVPSGYGFSNSYKVDVTTADTSISSTHMIYIPHKVEAQNIANSGWDYTNTSSYITLSFWARSVKAGTYNVVFRAEDVGAKYYPVEYTLVADTWKKISVSIPGDSSLVFNDDNGSGLDIRWNLQVGTDRDNGTADQWNATDTGNASTSNQVNFFDSVSNNFYLTGVQLEVGSQASDFQHEDIGTTLNKCYRYFQAHVSGDLYTGFFDGSSRSTSRVVCNGYQYFETMRTAPSLTVSNLGDFSIRDAPNNNKGSPTSITISRPGLNFCSVLFDKSGGGITSGNPHSVVADGTSTATLFFNSEL